MPFIMSNPLLKRRNSTVFWRWGFSICLVGSLLLGVGCTTGPSVKHCADMGPMGYSAHDDSLGVKEFLVLTAAEQNSRRASAQVWLNRFAQASTSSARIQALANAAGLAPDDPQVWLHLAHRWRWLGDYLKTVECLGAATEAIRNYDPKIHSWKINEMQRRTALARAWMHYDRGEWRQGLDWARAARQMAPGNASMRQIYGLLAGHSAMRSEARQMAEDLGRLDDGDTDVNWILASYRISTKQFRQAFNHIMELNPNKEHQAECWREMGEIAEYLGEWSRASRWYEESAHALPFRDTSCVTMVRHARMKPGSKKTHQKVWLAFDKYYITGSHSAYTNLAFRRFQRANDSQTRDFWAGQVVNAAGTLLRKGVDKPWTYRARGLVFAYGEKTDRSVRDLRRASELLAGVGRQDLKVESTLGHLLLKKKNHLAALGHLQAALELDPKKAGVWQDLGLAYVMSDKSYEAEKAFSRALDLDPGLATSWYNRGLLHLHRKEYGLAEIDLKEAARLAPHNEDVVNLYQKAKVLAR